MTTDDFFDESSEQSRVKSDIVAKYFYSWATVILLQPHVVEVAYIDLYAGKGRYDDGTPSTPIKILERAIRETKFRNAVRTYFNDSDPSKVVELKRNIFSLPGIGNLKFKPEIASFEVGEEVAAQLKSVALIPTLLFVDPWGYKGLSLDLIQSVLKDWGSDCIFFFNYNRINAGLTNSKFECRINQIFDKERADALRGEVDSWFPEEREPAIMASLFEALKAIGGRYAVPFCVKNEFGNRTSHYIVFTSKHELGYSIMKGIMAKASSSQVQGVASFCYNPIDKTVLPLFDYTHPLDDLQDDLLRTFSGRKLRMKDVFLEHNIGTPYIKSNYKDALINLEGIGKIVAMPAAANRKIIKGKLTFADDVEVIFPRR